MKIIFNFLRSIVFINLLISSNFIITNSLPFKPVVFVDKQTVLKEWNEYTIHQEKVRQNESLQARNKKELMEIEELKAIKRKELTDIMNNILAPKLYNTMKKIMQSLRACAVIHYSGGIDKELIDPAYDITQRVINDLNKVSKAD